MYRRIEIALCITLGAIVSTVHADVTEFDEDFEGWSNAIGEFTTIDFTGFDDGTFITDQLEDQGVVFTDDDNFINTGVFPDGAGLFDQETGLPVPNDMWLEFTQPMNAIGVDFPGNVQFELFNNGEKFFTSDDYLVFGGGIEFAGVVSDRTFDGARILGPGSGTAVIDNLYFGPPVPAPGALGLLGIAALMRRRRRRCA